MAVEIPVYVDISKAFNEAAREIPKEMPKLEKAISQKVLNVPIYWSGRGFSTVRDALTNTAVSSKELKQVLRDLEHQFDRLSQKEAGSARTSANVKNLAKAYALVEQRLTGVYNKNTAGAMLVENSINKVIAKLNTLRATLATQTAGTDAFNKTNYQIRVQEERLAQLNTQLRAYRISTAEANTAMTTQSRLLTQITSQMGAYVSIFGLLRFAKQIRDVTGELEYQRVALGHLIQDEEYGAKLFEQIKAAAVESPFRITQLVTYTKQLAAYRIEQESLFDTTKRLADISAGLGVDMQRLILAYGQVRAASVLRGQELRQFTEAGIPLVELLAEKFEELQGKAVSTADVFKLISQRAVPFQMIADIFEDLTDKGGMFYEMQKEQADTLKGRWEKLKDTFDIALQSIGETKTFERYNTWILDSLKFLAQYIRVIPKLLEGMTLGWASYSIAVLLAGKRTKQQISYEVALAASQKASATQIGGLTLKIFGEARAREWLTRAYAKQAIGATALSRAMGRLTVAMLANPIPAILAGVAALTAIFTTFRKRTEDAASSLEYLDKAIEGLSNAEKEFTKSEKLIDRYEKLGSNTERTAKESQKLYTTLSQLSEIYPELNLGIDNENLSLEEQISLLKETRIEREKQARAEAEGTLGIAKKDLEDALALQKKYEASWREAAGQQQNYEQLGYKGSERYWRKEASKRKEDLDEIREKVTKLYKDIERLENLLDTEGESKGLAEWQKQVTKLQNEMLKTTQTPVFTPEEIEKMESVYDLFGKLKKRTTDLEESLNGMREAFSKMAEGDAKDALGNEIADTEATLAIAKAIKDLFGFVFSKSSSGYTQDPFIQQMQDRIKFMKDFQKGYEDLTKYMAKSSALSEEAGIMLTRGLSMGLGAEEQKRAAEDLSNWYKDTMDTVFDYLKTKKGVTGSMQDFLSKQFTGNTNRDKMLKDFQNLLQSLWDAKTDFDISQKKKDLEEALKRLSDDIKRSETARDFYQNILDLTGDEELAATMGVSVYGGLGADFKDRMQEQLNKALGSLDASAITDDLRAAFANQNFATILANLDKFPEEWRKLLKQMAEDNEKYNANLIQTWLKELEKSKSYAEKRVQLAKQTAQRIAEINASSLPDEQKQSLASQYTRKEAEDAAKLQYEAFKDSPLYVDMFDQLDRASTRMLESMRNNLVLLKDQWKDLDPTQIKELQSRLNDIDTQLSQRNPFRSIIDGIKEYRELMKSGRTRKGDEESAIVSETVLGDQKKLLDELSQTYEVRKAEYELVVKNKNATQAEVDAAADALQQAKIDLDTQAEITNQAEAQRDAAHDIAKEWKKASDKIIAGAEGLSQMNQHASSVLSSAKEIVDAFGSDDSAEYFDIISEGIGKTMEGATSAALGIGKLLIGDMTGIADLIKGIGDIVVGIAGSTKKINIKRLNQEIKEQSRIIADLEDAYDSLASALDRAFGNERVYNFNEMLKVMAAEAEAYRKQAAAERQKGKKADEDTARGYERSAEDLEEKMADLRRQQESYFAGQDLSSAAEAFADAWLSAYEEFGDTSQAIEERMTEMVQNLIKKAALSGIAQNILGDWYSSLADVTDWNAQTIAEKWREAMALVGPMVDGMQVFANSMQAEGMSLRNMAGSFTGISRDIAGASEESILGLSAGINTQNYYMSFVPQIHENLAQILVMMTGGNTVTTPTESGIEAMPSVQKMIYDHIPNMDANLNAMLQLMRRVVTVGNNGTYYVAVRM